MAKIYQYIPFFEKNKKKDNEEIKKKIETKKEAPGKQLSLFPEEEIKEPKKYKFDIPHDFDFSKEKSKKEIKKVKKSDLEKHPFFKYISPEILKKMTWKKSEGENAQEEIPENEIIYDIDSLPIQQGDYVICKDFEDLNTRQFEFLNAKPYHKVKSICDKNGRYYSSGEPHIEIGYKIPFKMKRFDRIERNIESKYKILFLQFDLPIDLHGEKDKYNYFRGQSKMSDLFQILFNEKLSDTFVEFCQYDEIYRTGNDFYIENLKIKDYDFVFFGFMSNFTTLVKMLISYLDEYGIPYLKYGTFKDLDNKAYEMHLLQSLGYPYIPSIMTSKITNKVLDRIKDWGYPVIVKDVDLNRGEGVWKIDSKKDLMQKFLWGNRLMLIQKFIPNDGDYRVISIKNKVELVIKKKRISGSKEFRANVARGGKAVKGSLPPDIIKMCEDISRHLICDIVGFDIIQDKDTGEYYVMETNSSPHFPTFSVISEINIPDIIVDYIIKKVKE